MTHPEFIKYLEEQLEYARQSVNTDHDHARNYSYKAVCDDIYHEGHEERQQSFMQVARFHDGRAKGHQSGVLTISEILKRANELTEKVVDKPTQST